MIRSSRWLLVLGLGACFQEADRIDTTTATNATTATETTSDGSTGTTDSSGATASASSADSDGPTAEAGTSGSGPGDNPYGRCVQPEDCPLAESKCVLDTCVPSCGPAMQCPMPPPPVQSTECTLLQCRLPCNEDDDEPLCPQGMTCAGGAFGFDAVASCVYDPP